MLELATSAAGVFVTLTYASEYLPENATLSPQQVKLWLKRIRKIADGKLRYFLVGEYGDETDRPHYHVALYGSVFNLCCNCRYQYNRDWRKCDCAIAKSWGMGKPFIGEITEKSAAYIAGYVCKKMTSKSDERLDGRHPEFARMSLKPGIGAKAVKDIARTLNTPNGAHLIIENGDVPSTLNYGKRKMPLGRYLKRLLREELGYDETLLKEKNALRWSAEIAESLTGRTKDSRKSVKEILVEDGKQDSMKQEARYKIYKPRRTL